jgi:hypothetical protein
MEGTLMVSSETRGRYAFCVDGDERGDISSGQGIAIRVGRLWISGHVEYDHDAIYVLPGPQTLEDVARMRGTPRAIPGYYMEADNGGVIGLCAGMTVRLL